MERTWILTHLALALREVDFADPALAGRPDVRERGVRLEVRPVREAPVGSVYSSPALELAAPVCRVDLLESAPGAGDRAHWHPEMVDGEPGERVFDEALGADPEGWLRTHLLDLPRLLAGAPAPVRERLLADAAPLAALADEVADRVAVSLAALRGPWPDVEHDDRGMAPIPSPA